MRTPEETRALFDQWAQTYATDMAHMNGPLTGYETSLATATALAPVDEGAHILDIGIGTGGFSALLEHQVASITGVDLSNIMLEKCQEQHPSYELHQGTFTHLPVADAGFDNVISSFTFHEVPLDERVRACQEVARVLKGGGWLTLLDIIFASDNAMQDAAEHLGGRWDDSEIYAFVGKLDAALRQAHFQQIYWQQTGPYHWAVCAQKPVEV